MAKFKITMADNTIIKGDRNIFDIFADGLGNTVLHNIEKYDGKGICIGKSGYAKLTNRWIVMVEQDSDK